MKPKATPLRLAALCAPLAMLPAAAAPNHPLICDGAYTGYTATGGAPLILNNSGGDGQRIQQAETPPGASYGGSCAGCLLAAFAVNVGDSPLPANDFQMIGVYDADCKAVEAPRQKLWRQQAQHICCQVQAIMAQDATPPAPRYQFFILGLWAQPGQPGRPVAWRISLENPQTAERKGFTDLAELDAFLAAWMAGGRVNGER